MSRARDLANLGDGIAVADLPNTVVIKDGSNDVTLNNITATGVYLGGTGAANYLDDYEEGTWTPVFKGNTTAGSYTANATYSTANYTKIGNIVTIELSLVDITQSSAGSGIITISGLPFNCIGGYRGPTGNLRLRQYANATDAHQYVHGQPNTASMFLYYATPSNGDKETAFDMSTHFGANMDLMVSMTYLTTS